MGAHKTFAGEFEDEHEPITPTSNDMTLEMFVIFTLMALVCAAFLGLLESSVPKGIMNLIIFLGLLWGFGLGAAITDNDLLRFLVFPFATTAVLFGLVHLVFPKFFPALGRSFLKDVDKDK